MKKKNVYKKRESKKNCGQDTEEMIEHTFEIKLFLLMNFGSFVVLH